MSVPDCFWLLVDGDGEPVYVEAAQDGKAPDPGELSAYRVLTVVHFTDEELDRMLWWLRRPVHPGPAKVLDEAILRKLGATKRS